MQFPAPVAAYRDQRQVGPVPVLVLPEGSQQGIYKTRPQADQRARLLALPEALVQVVGGYGDGLFATVDRLAVGQLPGQGRGIEQGSGQCADVGVHGYTGSDSLLRRVYTSQPVAVTPRVCSHWADRRPSRVVTVQPSFWFSLV